MKTRVTFSWRQFVLGLLFGLFVFSLAACSSGPQARDPFFRLSGTIGSSESKATANRGTPDQDSLSGRGMAVGLRGEVVQPVSYFENVEVGLRVGLTGRDAQASPDGVQVDAESGELAAAGVLRGLLPLSKESRLSIYGEGFAGYAHNWGTVSGGPIDVRGSGGGLLFGAGVGLDFGNGLSLGLEWSRRDYDDGPVEFRSEDVVLVLGGVIRF